MAKAKQRLSKLLEQMNPEQQQSLLDYAEFLLQKSAAAESSESKQQPLEQPRPQQENVVAAIKRLRASYFMLNTDDLLNETSSLMAEFMIQGRDASAVIDDLEQLFDNHYQKYLQS
ncbi:MAG: DUF2281 domain-containing protein [Gammaproteobacteria bacterium]|nr:DUF2281 domain-containing protein [Gammaproteobacteria bacterium]